MAAGCAAAVPSDIHAPRWLPLPQLIEKTNMVDYAVDIYQQLNGTDEVSPLRAPTA